MPKPIVITGASDNVGTALLRKLAEEPAGYDIVGVSRRQPPPDELGPLTTRRVP